MVGGCRQAQDWQAGAIFLLLGFLGRMGRMLFKLVQCLDFWSVGLLIYSKMYMANKCESSFIVMFWLHVG